MEPTPEIQRVTVKAKDPKKVAAGRAGAAAKQAKEDKLKADLQEAKLKLMGDSQVDPPESELPEQGPPPEDGQPELPVRNATGWIPGLIGGLGLAGAVYYIYISVKPWGSRGKQAPPDGLNNNKVIVINEKPQPPSPQLKNPHYMA